LRCALTCRRNVCGWISELLGREPITATFELWRDDHDANLSLLSELVEAVAADRYEQNVETFKHNRVGVTGDSSFKAERRSTNIQQWRQQR